jgi:5-methylcytosine-specific restriction protein A
MPYFPAGPCRWRPCPKRGEHDGFCDEHRKQRNREYNKQRRADPDSNADIYNSSRWWTLRRSYLAAHPLCQICLQENRVVEANTVDHKVPIRQGGDPWDWDNLQALDARCHSRKSALEGSRWGSR